MGFFFPARTGGARRRRGRKGRQRAGAADAGADTDCGTAALAGGGPQLRVWASMTEAARSVGKVGKAGSRRRIAAWDRAGTVRRASEPRHRGGGGERNAASETYRSSYNPYLPLPRELQNLPSARRRLLPEVAEPVVALEVEVLVLVAEDVLHRQAGDLEAGLLCRVRVSVGCSAAPPLLRGPARHTGSIAASRDQTRSNEIKRD